MTLCIVYKHSNGGYLPCRHDSDSGRNVRYVFLLYFVKGEFGAQTLFFTKFSDVIGALLEGTNDVPEKFAYGMYPSSETYSTKDGKIRRWRKQ